MSRLGLIVLIIVIAGGGGYWYKNTQIKEGFKEIKIGKTKIKALVRDTMEGRSRGLSGHEKLEEDEGMLFVFPVASKYSFWMKEMGFDLDIIWIKGDKIVDISENVEALEGGKTRVSPSEAVNRVLEVNSGFVEKNGIKVGDIIKY